jgi:DNA-binding SARP family transcriptional activator
MLLEIRLLGQPEVRVLGAPVALPPKAHLIVAALVAERGGPLTAEQLSDRISDDMELQSPLKQVYEHVNKLRATLNRAHGEAGALVPAASAGKGYRLKVDPALVKVDLYEFEEALRSVQALKGRDDAEFVRLSREFLTRWSGEPLAGLKGRWADSYRTGIQKRRRDARIACLKAELQLGRHQEIIPELEALTRVSPHDEQAAELLMRAHYRDGSPAEALLVFERMRDQPEGIRPSQRLKRLFQRVKDRDPALDLPELVITETAIVHRGDDVKDDNETSAETPREEQQTPRIDRVDALATGLFGTAIKNQWNITDSSVYYSDGDMEITEPPREAP